MVRRKITEVIQDNQNNKACNVTVFEPLLCVLKSHAIQFAAYINRGARENLDKLELELS